MTALHDQPTPTELEHELSRPTHRPLLVSGATVLSVDPAVGDLPTGDVLVRDGVTAAVGPDLRGSAGLEALVLDARGTVAIPGFVDAHVHAWEGQLRGLGPTVDFGGYLGLTAFGIGPRYSPGDAYAGTLATALVALDGGVTTLVDNAHNPRTPDHARAGIEALAAAGIRGVHAVGASFGSAMPELADLAVALRAEYAGELLSVRLFDINPSVALWERARAEELWVSSELGPHTPRIDALVAELSSRGLLTREHALNHCYDLAPDTWARIADSGAAVNMAPPSDATFGLGSTVSPVGQALARGVPLGLSGDNEISYGLSIFAEMQNLLSRHRGEQFRRADQFRRTGAGEQPDAVSLTPADLLRAATPGGAANAGLAATVGSLTPGKQADLVLIRGTDLNTWGVDDPVAAVTAFAHTGNVDTVIVGGRLRKGGGRLVGVDLQEVRELVRRSRQRLLDPAIAVDAPEPVGVA